MRICYARLFLFKCRMKLLCKNSPFRSLKVVLSLMDNRQVNYFLMQRLGGASLAPPLLPDLNHSSQLSVASHQSDETLLSFLGREIFIFVSTPVSQAQGHSEHSP